MQVPALLTCVAAASASAEGSAAAASASAATGAAATARGPNVLFAVFDDLRPELAVAGYNRSWVHTPHIASVAARGTTFLRAYTQAPQCCEPPWHCRNTKTVAVLPNHGLRDHAPPPQVRPATHS